jgi:hypothetical protein
MRFKAYRGPDMRYFVLVPSHEGLPQHIVAEVVDDTDDKQTSLASSVAGAKSQILTEDELLQLPDGGNILNRWIQRDDATFESHTQRFLDGSGRPGRRVHLRLVRHEVATQVHQAYENSRDHARILQRAVHLIEEAQELISASKGARRVSNNREAISGERDTESVS